MNNKKKIKNSNQAGKAHLYIILLTNPEFQLAELLHKKPFKFREIEMYYSTRVSLSDTSMQYK